ncbi:MAG: TRZ/ATZ family hydrolase [Chromatiales bacterium]|jgi:5-methylthioadenosine/S-adenosylhomocysteine deaminase
MTKKVESLIHAGWVIPVEPENSVLRHHSIAINHGLISDILPTELAKQSYQAEEEFELGQHALFPGFINAHTHTPMSLFRGLADDLPLMDWLNNHIWPAEAHWVGEEFVADGSRLAIAEMVKSGTTCFNDMYFFPDITAHVAASAHMRACVGLIVIDFPSAWAEDHDQYLDKGLKLHDQYRGHDLVRTAFAPHAPYSVADTALSRIQMLANELEIPVHMHVHETQDEIRMSLDSHRKRPLARLADLGLLTPSLLGVHMTQLDKQEIRQIADNGCHVVHCPQSNLKLASGFCQVETLVQAGVNVALGTDGAASNNNLDMLEEMRTAALLAKGVAGKADAIAASTALKMATLNGAIALGIGDITGSLKPGKAADLCAIRLTGLAAEPVYNPVSQIVYASHSSQISDVWIQGRQVLREHQLTTLDEQQILDRTREWQHKILLSVQN